MSDTTDLPSADRRMEMVSELAALSRGGHKGSSRWGELQNELAQLRVDDARTGLVSPGGESLRSRVIGALRDAPSSTPTQLAKALDKSTTVVSRVLSTLLDSGVVEFAGTDDDRRKRLYSLVEAADTGAPPPGAVEVEREHVALAIAVAVEARRKRHDLEYARDRLERLVVQATRIGAADLTLLARMELITTLRQESETVPALRAPRLEHLNIIAAQLSATGAALPSYLVAPALGCHEYEMGRDASTPLPDRLRHLTAAEMAFARCEEIDQAREWHPREGWALLSRAELWRKSTEFGKAQTLAVQANAIFETYDDRYGAAEAMRVLGFCQRLRGEFHDAITTLRHALALEGAAVSDRCRADVLLQLGDAHRCVGHLDSARGYLSEAQELADSLGRTTTLGFVLSSLAAVAYAAGSLDEALTFAERASRTLRAQPTGLAMTHRRLAVITRDLAEGGDVDQAATSAALFRESLAEYRAVGSPAGAAACLVGFGKLAGEHEDVAAADLTELASSIHGRVLLPKDPWLPGLVTQWARDTDREDVQEVVDWTFSGQHIPQDSPEMAAEPRILSTVSAA